MRILHLVSYPLYSGPLPGTLALARAQVRLGHTVWLVCDRVRGNFDGYEESAEPYVRQMGPYPPAGLSLTLSTKASLGQHVADWRSLRAFLRRRGADVVHTHLSHDHSLVALAGSHGVPHVRTLHATRALTRRFGQLALLRRAGGLIVRSTAHRHRLRALLGPAQGHLACIPGSVDCAAWHIAAPAERQARRAACRAALAIPEDARLLGLVALMAQRGQEELLAALAAPGPAALGRIHVLLVGDGPQAMALRAQALRPPLAGRVHFTGYIQAERLRDAYAAMDGCMVMQPGNDASARAALEAMAAGLPVMAPADDALAELVDAETGYVIAERSAAGVAAALVAWQADPSAAQRRGRAAAQRMAAGRGVQNEAAATLAFYAQVASGPRTP